LAGRPAPPLWSRPSGWYPAKTSAPNDSTSSSPACAVTVSTTTGQSVLISTITRVYDRQTVVLVQFTGAGLIGGSLADGRYVISIDGSQIHNQKGTAYNGGNMITQGFFRLFGDCNGDAKVDATDMAAIQAALRSMDGTSLYR
jgi:hypothetical protein